MRVPVTYSVSERTRRLPLSWCQSITTAFASSKKAFPWKLSLLWRRLQRTTRPSAMSEIKRAEEGRGCIFPALILIRAIRHRRDRQRRYQSGCIGSILILKVLGLKMDRTGADRPLSGEEEGLASRVSCPRPVSADPFTMEVKPEHQTLWLFQSRQRFYENRGFIQNNGDDAPHF